MKSKDDKPVIGRGSGFGTLKEMRESIRAMEKKRGIVSQRYRLRGSHYGSPKGIPLPTPNPVFLDPRYA